MTTLAFCVTIFICQRGMAKQVWKPSGLALEIMVALSARQTFLIALRQPVASRFFGRILDD